MKRLIPSLLLLPITLALLSPVCAATTYFLSPTGADTGNCISSPCYSINYLQSIVHPGDTVMIHGGIYNVSSTITPSVNNVAYQAITGQVPLMIGAQQLSGWMPSSTGDCVYNSVPILNCYSVTIPNVSTLKYFDYFVYIPPNTPTMTAALSDTRRSQSINSSTTYYLNAGAIQKGPNDNCMATDTSNNCLDRVLVDPADFTDVGGVPTHNMNDIKFYNFNAWNVDVLRIQQVTPNYLNGKTRIIFTGNASASGFLSSGQFLRYSIVNSVEYFRKNATPGSFYIECSGGCVKSTNGNPIAGATIYYIARSSSSADDPRNGTVLVPQVSPLLLETGVNNLTFNGIYFGGDNFVPLYAGYASTTGQPDVPAALSFINTTGVAFEGSVISHTAGWGLEFTNNTCLRNGNPCTVNGPSTRNSFTDGVMYDIGASGLRLGRYPPNPTDQGNGDTLATNSTTITNDLFSGLGRLYPGGEAGCIWIGSSNLNTIRNNECADSYGGGIAVGPAVFFTEDFEHDNTITLNSFHDLGRGVIDDFGCVHFANRGGIKYKTGMGDEFKNNICHDILHWITDPIQGATGIYIDNNSQYVTASYNLVYRTTGALFFDNTNDPLVCITSCNNTVSNNIFAHSYQSPIKRGGDLTQDFTFSNNIVWYQISGPQWTDNPNKWDCDPTNGQVCTNYFNFVSNDYYSPTLSQPPSFVTTSPNKSWTWQQWMGNIKQPDEDQGSLSVLPNFKNPSCTGTDPDDYKFTTGGPPNIGWNVNLFFPTYGAGRSNAVLTVAPASTFFPLQTLDCLTY